MAARIIAAAVFALAVLTLRANALAVTEYCPVSVNVWPRFADPKPKTPSSQPSDTYNVHFTAESPRTVTGNLEIHTDAGWFIAPFSKVALSEDDQKWRGPSSEFVRHAAASNYYFLRFPSPVKLLAAFVSDAETRGETELGWDARGHVGCMSQPDIGQMPQSNVSQRPLYEFTLLNATHPPETIPASAVFLVPSPSNFTPGSTACEKPFAMAGVSNAASPLYPDMARQMGGPSATVLVTVAVSETGALDDAWIYAPSGSTPIDQAALGAARASTYVPSRSFCQEVPGLYLFRAEFRP